MRIGVIGILGSIGKGRSRSSRNCQELQSYVVGLSSCFRDRKDRIFLQIWVRFDRPVKSFLKLRDRRP